MAECRPELREVVIGELFTERLGERPDNSPILSRFTRRETGAIGHLHAAFGIDPGARLLGIGRARQDDVGIVRAVVAVAADIDDALGGLGREVQFVSAEVAMGATRSVWTIDGRRSPMR